MNVQMPNGDLVAQVDVDAATVPAGYVRDPQDPRRFKPEKREGLPTKPQRGPCHGCGGL